MICNQGVTGSNPVAGTNDFIRLVGSSQEDLNVGVPLGSISTPLNTGPKAAPLGWRRRQPRRSPSGHYSSPPLAS